MLSPGFIGELEHHPHWSWKGVAEGLYVSHGVQQYGLVFLAGTHALVLPGI